MTTNTDLVIPNIFPVFCNPQIRLRPPAGSNNPAFKREWDSLINTCETALLDLQVRFTHSESLRLQRVAKSNFDALALITPDREALSEAEAAAATVTSRTRADRHQKNRKQWTYDLEKAEQKALGIKKGQRGSGKARPQSNQTNDNQKKVS